MRVHNLAHSFLRLSRVSRAVSFAQLGASRLFLSTLVVTWTVQKLVRRMLPTAAALLDELSPERCSKEVIRVSLGRADMPLTSSA
jgi:hypothetical protein